MPSNQEYKGKGMKGRSYDELSGVGTSKAGVNGVTGTLNDTGNDGGVGAPPLSDSGNRQQVPTGREDGTPAQGSNTRGQANPGNRQQDQQGRQQK